MRAAESQGAREEDPCLGWEFWVLAFGDPQTPPVPAGVVAVDAGHMLGKLPTSGECQAGVWRLVGRSAWSEFLWSQAGEPKLDMLPSFPSESHSIFWLPCGMERGQESGHSKQETTKPLPLVTSADRELMPSTLIGIHVWWV